CNLSACVDLCRVAAVSTGKRTKILQLPVIPTENVRDEAVEIDAIWRVRIHHVSVRVAGSGPSTVEDPASWAISRWFACEATEGSEIDELIIMVSSFLRDGLSSQLAWDHEPS